MKVRQSAKRVKWTGIMQTDHSADEKGGEIAYQQEKEANHTLKEKAARLAQK